MSAPARDASDPPLTAITAYSVRMSGIAYLRSLWQRRDFIVALPAEQLRVRHQNTLLGNLWHLTNPLLSVAVYFAIFGLVFEVDRGVDNFLVWLTTGIFAYRLTTSTVMQCAGSIENNLGLIRSFRFPRAALPITSTISELMAFGFEMAVIAAVVVLSGIDVSTRLLLLPLVLVVHTAFNLGIGFIMARLSDAFADVRELIPFVFRLLMYVSGVIFPIKMIVERAADRPWVGAVVENNPIAVILSMYRWAILGTEIDPTTVAWTSATSAVLLMLGFRFFRAVEHRYGR